MNLTSWIPNHPVRSLIQIPLAASILLGLCGYLPAKAATDRPVSPLVTSPLPASIISPGPPDKTPSIESELAEAIPPNGQQLPAEDADLLTEGTPAAAIAEPDHIESFASYYAKRFKGKRTASGERYNPELMTAATRDFPLHSWLRVINPANGKDVIVRINDLTSKRKTPLIDLSRAAAKELEFLGKGKIRVHVIPLLPSP